MSRCGNVGDGITSHVCPGSPGEDAAALGGAGTEGVSSGAGNGSGLRSGSVGGAVAGRVVVGNGSGLGSGRVGDSGAGVGCEMSGESDGRGRFGAGEGMGSAMGPRKQRSGRRPLPREAMVTEPPKMSLVPGDGARRMWARSRVMMERVAQVSRRKGMGVPEPSG